MAHPDANDSHSSDTGIAEHLKIALHALHEMPAQIGALHRHDDEPRVKSPAFREREQCSRIELLDDAYAQGRQLVFLASADHVNGLIRSLKTPMLSCTPYTSARAVLEACSTAIWILDTELGHKTRIERSLNLRLDNLRSQGRFRDKVQNRSKDQHAEWLKQTDPSMFQGRIDHLRACARDARVPERKKGSRFRHFGSGLPTISERIRDTLNAETLYSMFSFVAHGNHSGLLQLSGSVQHTPQGAILEPKLNPINAIFLINKVVQWHSRAAWAYFTLFGLQQQQIATFLERAYDQLGLKPELRFWRCHPGNDAKQT